MSDLFNEMMEEISQQNIKISDLEAKLAEKDQAIEGLQELNKSLGQTCNNDAKEIERLREQIEEKDVEIENLKNANNGLSELIGMKDKTFYAIEINEFKKKQNQTAIAELEKVKKLLDDCYGYEYTSLYHFIQSKAEEKIDQQIKELKGEK